MSKSKSAWFLPILAPVTLLVSHSSSFAAQTAPGLCLDNIGASENGHEQRCCSNETKDAYFLDAATGKPRHCGGKWFNTGSGCTLNKWTKAQGQVWKCDVPGEFDEPESLAKAPQEESVQTPPKELTPNGHCKNNVGVSPNGHQRRCCRADTHPDYFLDEKTLKPRHCSGNWFNTRASCGMGGGQAGDLWKCDKPGDPEEDLDDEEEEDLTDNVPVGGGAKPKSKAFILAASANKLAAMSLPSYQKVQKKWKYPRRPACNFFLGTAMCEAGLCAGQKAGPVVGASVFDDFLHKKTWRSVNLATLKKMFKSGEDFDVILQRDPWGKSKHGHVAIGVQLSSTGGMIIADGALDDYYKKRRTVSTHYLTKNKGGFEFLVRD